MRRKYTIDPVTPGIKFEFDRDSTKEFGGMVVNRKIGQASRAKVPPYTQSSRPKPKFNRAAEQIARYEAKPNRRKKSADVPRQKPVSRRMIP